MHDGTDIAGYEHAQDAAGGPADAGHGSGGLPPGWDVSSIPGMDPAVANALDQASSVDHSVHDLVTSLQHDHGQPGDAAEAAGSGLDAGTQSVLDFAHGLDRQAQPITDIVKTVDSGQHITEKEMQGIEAMGRSDGAWINILNGLNASDRISNSVANDESHEVADRAAWDTRMNADEANIDAQVVQGNADTALHNAESATGDYTG